MENSPLQRDLDSISEKCASLNLRLNPLKCTVMRFGDRRGHSEVQYSISGQALCFVNSVKDLGVLVDSSLRFHGHIREVARKAGGLMSSLLRATVCRSSNFMVTLYISHIRPILDYASSVWNTNYLADIRLLESLQRRWTREIAGLQQLPYEERLKRANLYSVYGRLLRVDMIKVWKSFHSEVDVGLSSLFQRSAVTGTRGHTYKLAVVRSRTETRRRFFAVRVVSHWNALPLGVVESATLGTFKSRLDDWLGDLLYSSL